MDNHNPEKLKRTARFLCAVLYNQTCKILLVSSLIFCCMTAGSSMTSSEVVRRNEFSCRPASPIGDNVAVLSTGDIVIFSLAILAFSWSIFSLQARNRFVRLGPHDAHQCSGYGYSVDTLSGVATGWTRVDMNLWHNTAYKKRYIVLHVYCLLCFKLLLLLLYAFAFAFLYLWRYHTTTTTVYSPFSRTTRVSRCQNRTSGLYGARED